VPPITGRVPHSDASMTPRVGKSLLLAHETDQTPERTTKPKEEGEDREECSRHEHCTQSQSRIIGSVGRLGPRKCKEYEQADDADAHKHRPGKVAPGAAVSERSGESESRQNGKSPQGIQRRSLRDPGNRDGWPQSWRLEST